MKGPSEENAAAEPTRAVGLPAAAADAATLPPPANRASLAAESLPSFSISESGVVAGGLPAAFGRYQLRQLLGKGGMGTVYLAHDPQLDRQVALKIPSLAGAANPELTERFLREARAAATLVHPNICPVFDVGQCGGVFYLTMCYIEGTSLAAVLRSRGPYPAAEAATVVQQLALAMQEAHDQGIIHRDLKPANIMIDRRGAPIIMDFGLARRVVAGGTADRLTHSGVLIGTPAYMSPEQVDGDLNAMGAGCDIYSLGVILYELLTGRLPFEGSFGTLIAQIVSDPPPPPSALRPDLDPALEAVCLRALAKNPADRYPSMKDFAAALDQWRRGAAPAPPAGAAASNMRPQRRSEENRTEQIFADVTPEIAPFRPLEEPVLTNGDRRGLRPRWFWWIGALIVALVLLVAFLHR